MKDFLTSRVRPALQSSPYLNGLIDNNNNNMQQMSIRDSRVFFRSGSSSSQVEGIDISVLMMDEYERMADSGGESSALQSMKGSNKYGLVRRWSTPSLPDYGIHKRYLEGDQRKWMIKCEHCGYWQEMTFKDNVKVIDKDLIDNKTRKAMPGSCMYVCQKCGKNFDSSRWYNGKWVKTRTDPNLPASFYVSQLNAVWIGPEDIYTDYLRSTNPQFFYNYTLGIPYENNQSGMNKEDFMEHRADDLPERITHYTTGKYTYVTFGIDWGTHYHHLTVLGMTAEGKFELINAIRIQNSNETGQIEEDLRQVINQINIYEPDLVYCDIGLN